jgi:hypothetical protein
MHTASASAAQPAASPNIHLPHSIRYPFESKETLRPAHQLAVSVSSACAGSQLEGGGQILRNAVALSALTGRSIHVDKIRAGVHAEQQFRQQHLPGDSSAHRPLRYCLGVASVLLGMTLCRTHDTVCKNGFRVHESGLLAYMLG